MVDCVLQSVWVWVQAHRSCSAVVGFMENIAWQCSDAQLSRVRISEPAESRCSESADSRCSESAENGSDEGTIDGLSGGFGVSGGSGSGMVPLACPHNRSAISVISVAIPLISAHTGSPEPRRLYLQSAVEIYAMQARAWSSIIGCPCQWSDVPMEPAATRPVVRVLRRVARLKIVQLGLDIRW